MAIKGRVLLSQEDPPTGRIDLKSRQDKLSSQLKGVTKGTKTVKKHKIFHFLQANQEVVTKTTNEYRGTAFPECLNQEKR